MVQLTGAGQTHSRNQGDISSETLKTTDQVFCFFIYTSFCIQITEKNCLNHSYFKISTARRRNIQQIVSGHYLLPPTVAIKLIHKISGNWVNMETVEEIVRLLNNEERKVVTTYSGNLTNMEVLLQSNTPSIPQQYILWYKIRY